ncbi:MAG: cytosine permease [Thermacetogeniaceae bacterium]
MSKDLDKQVSDEIYYGIIPVLSKEKIYSGLDIFIVLSGISIATWCYTHGAHMAESMGLLPSILNIFFAMTLASLFVILVCVIATRLGVDIWVYQRAILGNLGSNIFLILFFLATWGWYAINAKVFGSSMAKLITAITGIKVGAFGETLLALVCVFLGWWIAIRGPIAVRTGNKLMVPCLYAIGLLLIVLVLRHWSLSELIALKPPHPMEKSWSNYALVLEWNFAYLFAWYPTLGALPRLVKTERGSYWGCVGGFGITLALFVCIGAVAGLALTTVGVESVDPTDWLVKLGGPWLGILSLILVGFANVSTASAGTYSHVLSSKILKPDMKYWHLATLWCLWCALLVCWGGIWRHYNTFLAVIGAMAGPPIGLLIADFFIVRKRKINLKFVYGVDDPNSCTFTYGFNLVGIAALILGMIAFCAVYDPINYVGRSALFNYTTATPFSAVVAMLSYYLMSRIPAVRRYMKLDV